MTLQTSAPLTQHHLSSSPRRAHEIAVTFVDEGWLDVAPPYQRGSVWTQAQRLGLVKSFLLGMPVPSVLVNDRGTNGWAAANGSTPLATGEPPYALVDGRQRIETMSAWFRGDLPVPASWFPAEDVAVTVATDDGPYVTNMGLTERGRAFLTHRAILPVVEAKVTTVAAEADLYLLVNGAGTAQTQADLDNARRYATGA